VAGQRQIASGRLFQALGPATAKARSPIVVRRIAGTMRSADDAERRRSAGSSAQTHVRTGRPVSTACTECAEVCAPSGGP